MPNKSSNCDRFCQQRQERLFTQLALVKEQRTPYIAGQLQGQCKEKIYAGCERYDTTLPAINGSHDTYYDGYDRMAKVLGATNFPTTFRLNLEPCMPVDDAFLSKLNRYLRDHFGIHYYKGVRSSTTDARVENIRYYRNFIETESDDYDPIDDKQRSTHIMHYPHAILNFEHPADVRPFSSHTAQNACVKKFELTGLWYDMELPVYNNKYRLSHPLPNDMARQQDGNGMTYDASVIDRDFVQRMERKSQ